ncbi:Tyrosine recombinase XerD [bioreactor metagenome]|uniref:Tyrosine recombinase XerD n=1 Tax=bioreactor metagenome TaxID=1076179 RepID=A0A644Y1G9_9ZZZZ
MEREFPPVIQNFLTYMETIKGRSALTVDEYGLDLRMFFRFVMRARGAFPSSAQLDEIDISGLDLDFVRTVTLSDIYEFLNYLARSRDDINTTRARKVSTLKSYFGYMSTRMHLIDENPTAALEAPKIRTALPVHLTLEEAQALLSGISGRNRVRDYAILTLFLNCGMRLAELVGMNITDIDFTGGSAKIKGKGDKERIIYLNPACMDAVKSYLKIRPVDGVEASSRNALFLSGQNRRIGRSAVQKLVEKHLSQTGLGDRGYSTHKLRHTAATLMFQEGVDVRTLKEVLGHEQLNTTQIYTHVSNEGVRDAMNKNPLADIKKGSR